MFSVSLFLVFFFYSQLIPFFFLFISRISLTVSCFHDICSCMNVRLLACWLFEERRDWKKKKDQIHRVLTQKTGQKTNEHCCNQWHICQNLVYYLVTRMYGDRSSCAAVWRQTGLRHKQSSEHLKKTNHLVLSSVRASYCQFDVHFFFPLQSHRTMRSSRKVRAFLHWPRDKWSWSEIPGTSHRVVIVGEMEAA